MSGHYGLIMDQHKHIIVRTQKPCTHFMDNNKCIRNNVSTKDYCNRHSNVIASYLYCRIIVGYKGFYSAL